MEIYMEKMKFICIHQKDIICDVTPLGASSQGLRPDRGGSRGSSFPYLGGCDPPPPPLKAEFYIFYLSSVGLRKGGRQGDSVYWERIDNRDPGIT